MISEASLSGKNKVRSDSGTSLNILVRAENRPSHPTQAICSIECFGFPKSKIIASNLAIPITRHKIDYIMARVFEIEIKRILNIF